MPVSSDSRFLLGPFKQLIPMKGLSMRGPIADSALTVIQNGALIIKNGIIEEVGIFDELKAEKNISIVEISDRCVCIPGFIDSHTHICFSGSRTMDYAARNSGKSYLDIAKEGGGIWSTVQATRNANQEELIEGVLKRAERHLQMGITTLEVKSGYGLSTDAELKMLNCIKKADKVSAVDMISTCLAAHTMPKDFSGSNMDYLRSILIELLPVIKAQKLSNRVDMFVEESAFSIAEARFFLMQAKEMGFDITIHADQFTPGGSTVACEIEAISADHLEASTESEIVMLGRSKTIATVLPGASLGLGCQFAPARKLLDAGACLAIASDWNPGSAPMGNLLMQSAVLGAAEKLSHAEVFAGITFRGAAALNLEDRGVLGTGKMADLAIFPTDDYRDILYHQGMMLPSSIWKNGKKIAT
jgi:imidazolonepropionase